MDQTNLNVLKMLEPKKYKKKTPKTPLNKLFDMKNTHVMPDGTVMSGKKHNKNSYITKKKKKKKNKGY